MAWLHRNGKTLSHLKTEEKTRKKLNAFMISEYDKKFFLFEIMHRAASLFCSVGKVEKKISPSRLPENGEIELDDLKEKKK